jgi:mono/diheme cytochrome c family protein
MKDARRNAGSGKFIRRVLSAYMSGLILTSPLVVHAAEAGDRAALIAHGAYLVQKVAMCSDCHTPRDAHGELLLDRTLTGAPLGMAPVHPVPAWASQAPNIAGLPVGYTEESLATLLRSGHTVSGLPVRPPMPAYRMNGADARAVAAYLASLREGSSNGISR